MNMIQIMGHLGADPETRVTPSGQKVTTLRVATNVRKSGKDETVWWRVTIWGTNFDKMIAYLKKGSAVIAVGEMSKPEIYTDKEGRQQISLNMTADILKFSPFGKTDRENQTEKPAQQYATAAPFQGNESFSTAASGTGFASQNDDDDQMPF